MLDRHPRFQFGLILASAIALGVSLVDPIYARDQVLQHIPTVLGLVAMAFAAKRRSLSNLSMACLAAFVVLHVIGARYVYSFVPYREWLPFLDAEAAELAGERNHYDRFVHFASGLLFVSPLVECSVQRLGPARLAAYGGAIVTVLAIGAVYEIFEWGLTIVAAPDQAERYNGQQGDMWDAQKDMALAGLGAISAGGIGLLGGALRRDDPRRPERTPSAA